MLGSHWTASAGRHCSYAWRPARIERGRVSNAVPTLARTNMYTIERAQSTVRNVVSLDADGSLDLILLLAAAWSSGGNARVCVCVCLRVVYPIMWADVPFKVMNELSGKACCVRLSRVASPRLASRAHIKTNPSSVAVEGFLVLGSSSGVCVNVCGTYM